MTIKIEIKIEVFRSKGDNYGQWIAYNKEYELYGYGADKVEAIDMLKETIYQTLKMTKP